jgi:hypothetical protein
MNKYKIEIKWGMIFAAVTLVWLIGEKMCGLYSTYIDKHEIFTNIFFIPAILMLVMGIKEVKHVKYNGSITYMKAWVSGIVISLVDCIFTPLIQFLIHKIIAPEYFENAIKMAVSKGQMSLEQANQYFTLSTYIPAGVFMGLLCGIVLSAIIAFFLKNKIQVTN